MKDRRGSLYGRVVNELVSFMDRDRLAAAYGEKSFRVSADIIQDEFREAAIKSSLRVYNGKPYAFGGKIYESLESWEVMPSLVYDCMKSVGVPYGYYSKKRDISATICESLVMRPLVVNPSLMAFRNCIFDTEINEDMEFSPDNVAVSMVDYDYRPDDLPTRWMAFLDRVLPDKKMQNILQEFLGAVFLDRRRVKVENILILLGNGANGKSVIFETVRGVLGEDNVSTFGIGSLISGSEKLKNIATINGKRINYAPEMQVSEFGGDADAFKTLASGEKQMVRYNFGNPFAATDIPLVMANANRMPAWNDPSYGMRRRFIIIPFDVEIPIEERDLKLADRLRSDYSAIFTWMIQGKQRFISNGYKFTTSSKVEEILDDLQRESSTVLQFVYARKYLYQPEAEWEEPVEVLATDLYADYRNWCLTAGIVQAEIESVQKFGRSMKSHNFSSHRLGGGVYYRIYGDRRNIKIPYMKEKGDEGRRKFEPKADMRPFTVNGRKYIRTVYGIARHFYVSEPTVRKALEETGLFQEATMQDKVDPRITCYDIEKVNQALRTVAQKRCKSEKEKKELALLWDKRSKFNARMRKLVLPYRKYDSKKDIYFQQNTDGLIRVPDDWEYSNEEPLEKQSTLIKRRRITREIDDYEKKE